MSELFRIETDRLLLVWSGVTGTEQARRLLATVNGLSPFALSEQTDYLLFLRSASEAPVALEHRDPVLLRGLTCSDGGRVIHGRINFGSQVGRSRFTLCAAGEPVQEFEVEVFPSKLDYAEDYTRLVAETQAILTGLVLEYLRSTFQLGQAARVTETTQLEWLILLRHAADELERALAEVARRPQRGLTREPQPARVERIRRADAALRRGVLRGVGRGRSVMLDEGVAVRERLEERRARPTLDTPEHRWLAVQLARLRRRLAELRREEAERGGGGERQQRALAEIGALEERIVRLCGLELLVAAGGEPPPGFASLQLQTSPGYREAYRSCLLLSQGLQLEGGPVRLSVKDLHLLYEYWCFLTLVRLLAEETDQPLPVNELLAVEQHGLRVRLKRGHEQTVAFRAAYGRRITLTYNPRFGGEPLLVPQQPDILLSVHHPGSPPRYLVLDAKYRIDSSAGYLARYGSPGPPEEALNALHRYRDAIVKAGSQAAAERRVSQAIALFPHRGSEPDRFRGSRLWHAIERIGVGAIPLLPGSTDYLREWVRRVVSE